MIKGINRINPTRCQRLLKILPVLYALVIALQAPSPAHGQGRQRMRMPAPMCALAMARVICYDARTATPQPISPPGVRILDFALSADAEWLVFRTETGSVQLAAVYGPARLTVDDQALPPATLPADAVSIAWAADGVALAYVTAAGLRVALPSPDGTPIFVDETERLFVNLRFSPGGGRLAAQSEAGDWTIYSLQTRRDLRRIGRVAQRGDLAWLDDNSLIVAPTLGGLLRLNVDDAAGQLAPAWERREGAYMRLSGTPEGEVLAMQVSAESLGQPGMLLNGPLVRVAADGAISPYSEVGFDARLVWVAPGRMLGYITSGTPIITDPVSGEEDALPIQRATRIAWAAPTLLSTNTLALDADLFYLAPGVGSDEATHRQIWQLPGDGQRAPVQLTRLNADALDFAISPDRSRLALTVAEGNGRSGSWLAVLPLADPLTLTPTPTPRRGTTPTPEAPGIDGAPGSRRAARIGWANGGQPDWSPDGRLIAYADGDGLFIVDTLGISVTLPQPVPVQGTAGYTRPRFSPDGRYLLGERPGASEGELTYRVLPLAVNSPAYPESQFTASRVVWGLNALFAIRAQDQGARLTAADTSGSADLLNSAWPLRDLQPMGGQPGLAGQVALALQRVGWLNGPESVQLVATNTPDPASTASSPPYLLDGALLSPTGRFAAGTTRATDGRISQLVIRDLQNGRIVAIRDAIEVSALRWVR